MHSRRALIGAGIATVSGLAVADGAGDAPSADWTMARPEDQGMAAAGVQRALDDGAAIPAMQCMLVARRGVLVAERYYGGVQAADLLAVNSVTKSVCSLLVGQALQQGRLQGLEQTVAQLLPEAAARYPQSPALNATVGQILTGTTGLAYDYRRQVRELVQAPDPVAWVLGLPADGRPAGNWSYNDAAVSLLTPILERAQGLPMADLVRRDLFAPLGIREFSWRAGAARHALAYAGLGLRGRDMLRLAATVCGGGVWNGTRVLPAAWVADSTRAHVVPDWRIRPIADPGYGYLWFTGTLDGQQVAWAWGYGGQFAMVVPARELAIVTLAADPVPAQLGAQTAAIMALVAQVVAAAA